jgi:glycine/D-amino acid oxidase-like deaminating enzyme
LQGLFHRRPTYILANGEDEVDFVARHGGDLSQIGESARLVKRSELERLIPGVGPAVTAALVVPGDGHAIGYQVVDRFLRDSDVLLMRSSRVQAVSYRDGRPECVLETGERIDADAVIIAAGLGSAGFLDFGAVMMPRRGQLIITDRASADGPPIGGHILGATYLAAKRGDKGLTSSVALAIDPLTTGQFLIGGSREDAVEARTTDIETVALVLREALQAYPPLVERRVIRTFAGIRAASIDGLPLIGRLPGVEHVFVATGFEGDGICLGPLVGRLIADMAMEQSLPAELAPFDPCRFSARQIRWAG